jgi:hypothetical protein
VKQTVTQLIYQHVSTSGAWSSQTTLLTRLCMGSTSLGTPSLLFQKPDNQVSLPEQPEEPEGPYEHVLDFLIRRKLLGKVLKDLKPHIPTLFSLARVCKATWQRLAADADLWRDVYLDNDPLITPQLRKRLVKSTYCDQSACITYKRTGLKQSKWLRCCTFLFHKPKVSVPPAACCTSAVRLCQ